MDIANALLSGFPGTKWKLEGNDYAKLDWFGPGEKPTLEELEAAWELVINPSAAPVVVTMRSLQLCMSLSQTMAISAAIASMPEGKNKRDARIYWTYSNTVSRSHPVVASFAQMISATDAEIDALFAAAKELDETPP